MAFYTVLYQVATMFILMAAGYFLYKIGILSEDACKSITRMLLLFVCPVVIVYSFQIKFSASLVHGLVISAISAVCAHVFGIVLSHFVFLRHPADVEHRNVLRFAAVYSNCGFVGIPLLAAVIGTKGIFYASVYIAVFNMFNWTHGVAVFRGKSDKSALREVLLNPNLIAVVIGLLLFCFSVSLPPLLRSGMLYVYDLNTPLAMIVIGARMAQIEPRSLLTDRLVLPGIAMKNIVIPCIALMILHLAGVSGTLLLACLIPIACPVAGNTVLFADMYGADTKFPTKLMSLSTLLCVISIPLLVYIVTVLKF